MSASACTRCMPRYYRYVTVVQFVAVLSRIDNYALKSSVKYTACAFCTVFFYRATHVKRMCIARTCYGPVSDCLFPAAFYGNDSMDRSGFRQKGNPQLSYIVL